MRAKHHLFPAALLVIFVISACATADPPALTIDAEVKPAGQYVRFTPKTDAVAVTYIGLSGVDPIPADVLKDGRMFLLDTRGIANGRYKFVAVAAGAKGEQTRADFAVVVGNVPPGPTPGPTPPDPGPTPTPAPLADLGRAIKAAYDLDSSTDKAAAVPVLSSTFKQLAAALAKNAYPTWRDFWIAYYDYRKAVPLIALNNELNPVYVDMKQRFAGSLDVPPVTPISLATAQQAADYFGQVAGILDGIVPPAPGPPPVPPAPPDPAPLPAAGLSVLIIEESGSRSTLPREQLLTMTATGPGSVGEYIAAKAIKGPDGKTPEFRIFDKDQNVSAESKFWQDAMALKRGPELPWLMVTNGKGGYSGPLPKTQVETLTILKKYGG